MFFDITDPFCTPVLRGIEERALSIIVRPDLCRRPQPEETGSNDTSRCCWSITWKALIVVANWLFVDIQLLADLSKRNITAATIGWEMPGNSVSSVMVDNETGGRLALEHLHQLGHRKIAYILGPKMLIDSAPRWKGIQKIRALGRNGDRSGAGSALAGSFDPNSGFEGGYRFTEELLHRKKKFNGIDGLRRPDGTGSYPGADQSGRESAGELLSCGFR